MVECTIAGLLLALTALLASDWAHHDTQTAANWLGALAVFYSFKYVTVADRMAGR